MRPLTVLKQCPCITISAGGRAHDDGFQGFFKTKKNSALCIVASWGLDWDHVSVSTPTRCPTWDEMCQVKDVFFDPSEVVMQLHPAKSEYVNHHPFCLHLWKPQKMVVPQPPSHFVGPRSSE